MKECTAPQPAALARPAVLRATPRSASRSRAALHAVLLASWLLASSWALLPTAHAAPVNAPNHAAPSQEPAQSAESLRAAGYLDQLLGEINVRRTRVGTPPIAYATQDANLAVAQYLADLTPQMVSRNTCFHGGTGAVTTVRPGWDYVALSGLGGEARGEVLACPGRDYFWTAQAIADGWWNSASHWRSLYADARVNAVACGTYGPGRGGSGYQTIACVTYRI